MFHPFLKMHGAGNDFVMFDARKAAVRFPAERLRAIADRRTGVGCDQIVFMEPSDRADVFMRIVNADGSEVASCGNATRCVGWLLMQQNGKDVATIDTAAGLLTCYRDGEKRIRTDMGEPQLEWRNIPLARPCDTLHLDIRMDGLNAPAAIGMGNPHMVFTVPDVACAPVSTCGPQLERHPLFPERANVSFAHIIDRSHIALRVWERGAGETLACGTAACATLVALHRRGLVDGKASIALPGGTLDIAWDKMDNHVWMTGPVAEVFNGTLLL